MLFMRTLANKFVNVRENNCDKIRYVRFNLIYQRSFVNFFLNAIEINNFDVVKFSTQYAWLNKFI